MEGDKNVHFRRLLHKEIFGLIILGPVGCFKLCSQKL
jgi:hypothetical protein